MTTSTPPPTVDRAERFLAGLNPFQREAVSTVEGPLLILAGPGSGKTRVIVHRVAYMLDVKDVDPKNVLAVTFTNKSAPQLRARLGTLLPPKLAPPLAAGTFHPNSPPSPLRELKSLLP